VGFVEGSEIMGQWHVILNDRILHRFWVEEGDTVRIGRGNMVDVTLDNTAISRQHASIEMRNGKYFISDLKSTNGTRVNGKSITERVPVTGADRIEIAKFRLVPAAGSGDTYPPYAMVLQADFDPASLPQTPADFDGTVYVASRHLILVEGQAVPKRLSLKDMAVVKIGKDDACHIRVSGGQIGKIQCCIVARGDKHYLVHQSGWKRTTINGKKVDQEQPLRKGDAIGVGTCKIRYE